MTAILQLQESAERAKDYHDSVMQVNKYLHLNHIDDPTKTMYFLLMGVVWTAMKRGDELSDEDTNIWLGLEDDTVLGIADIPVLREVAEVPLKDFLDYLKTNYFS